MAARRSLTDAQREQLVAHLAEGGTYASAGDLFGLHKTSVMRLLARDPELASAVAVASRKATRRAEERERKARAQARATPRTLGDTPMRQTPAQAPERAGVAQPRQPAPPSGHGGHGGSRIGRPILLGGASGWEPIRTGGAPPADWLAQRKNAPVEQVAALEMTSDGYQYFISGPDAPVPGRGSFIPGTEPQGYVLAV